MYTSTNMSYTAQTKFKIIFVPLFFKGNRRNPFLQCCIIDNHHLTTECMNTLLIHMHTYSHKWNVDAPVAIL